MANLRHPLDCGGRHHAVITESSAGFHGIALEHGLGDRRSRVHEGLLHHLLLIADGTPIAFPPGQHALHFPSPVRRMELRLLASPPLPLLRLDANLPERVVGVPSRLSHFETRFLATNGFPHGGQPMDLSSPADLTTDLHTHFAGCISARDLLRIGAECDVALPRQVLALAGVAAESSAPVPLAGMTPQVLQRLEAAMQVPEDRQITFLDMERIYLVRGPLTKSAAAFPSLCRQIARDYQTMGVRYAELSLSSIVTCETLSTLHTILPEIERETGVALRFLAAFSRHNDPEWDRDVIDRLGEVLDSPYVVGVDFMGHETNSTQAFLPQIHEIATLASGRRSRLVIRVHAGENPAYPENVRLAAQAGRGFDVQVRVGHGLYGADEETLGILRDTGAIVEFNLHSNLALNNILTAKEVPVRRYLDAGVGVVLGTDGYGIYQTSLEMEARAARLAGVTDADMAKLRETESQYVAMRLEADRHLDVSFRPPPDGPLRHFTPEVRERKVLQAIERKRAWTERLAELGVAELEPQEFETVRGERRCLLIAGAWQHAWQHVSSQNQAKVTSLLDRVLEGRTPENTLLMTGGTRFGVEGIVGQLAKRRGYDVVGAVVGAMDPANVDDTSMTHAVFVGETLYEKAARLFGLLRNCGGTVLFVGGGPVVSDEIRMAANLGVPSLLLQGPEGASTRYAKLQPDRAVSTADEILAKLAAWETERPQPEPYWHAGPNPTADAIVLRDVDRGDGCEVLLIRRDEDAPAEPGKWALPGGFLATSAPRGQRWMPGSETAEEACVRELWEETGLDVAGVPGRLVLVGVYEGGGRDPRDTREAWSQSTAYWVELPAELGAIAVTGADDACEAQWFPTHALPAPLAFDHAKLIEDATALRGAGGRKGK